MYNDKLDGIGHRFGPYSTEYIEYAKSLDRTLLQTYQKLEKTFKKKLTFSVFSDHSQCEQVFRVNILAELNKFGLNLGKDYLCFIDATLVLFWPQNDTKREKIIDVLRKIKLGTLIDSDQRKNYHLNFTDNRYGEIIFVLKPGGTFFPNFFSPFSAMKGLHGYLPEEEVQNAFLISNKEPRFELTHVKDIYKLLLSI